jgi:hypothetical protein
VALFHTIPKLWPDSTIVCIGNGPSITVWEVDDPVVGSKVARPHPDVTYCRGRARVLALTKAARLAPWADAVLLSYMTADLAAIEQPGYLQRLLHGAEPPLCIMPCTVPLVPPAGSRICYVRADVQSTGLSRDPSMLHARGAVGYAAINAAVHLGARRIVLLGYDHTNGEREYPGYETLIDQLRELGIDVVNASHETALTVFTRATIADALLGAACRPPAGRWCATSEPASE